MRWLVGALVVLAVVAAAIAGSWNPEPETSTAATPTPDPRIAIYRAHVDALAGRYREAQEQLDTLVNSPRVQDMRWLGQYREALDEMQQISAEVRRLGPPACLAAADAELQAAVSQLEQAVGLIQSGFMTVDGEMTIAGYRRLADAMESIEDATAEISKARCR